jgi:hypothetical protein
MTRYEIRGREVSFVVKITSLTTDAVTGSWSGDAYGEVIFNKASATNPMYKFEPTAVAVQIAGTGIVDAGNNYTVVQNANTGFVGVTGASLQVGSVIAVSGVFVKPSADVDAITKHRLSDSPSLDYGDGGAGNVVGSTLNGL